MKKLLIMIFVFYSINISSMEDKAYLTEDQVLRQTVYGQRVRDIGWDQGRREMEFWWTGKYSCEIALKVKEEATKTLIAGGLSPNFQFESLEGKPSLLALAAREESSALITYLLGHKADVNQRLGKGERPIFYARTRSIAELLVSKGADRDAQCDNGESFLDYMVHFVADRSLLSAEIPSLMKYLSDKDMNSRVCRMALIKLANREILRETHFQCAQIFLSAGIDLDAENWEGKTAENILQDKILNSTIQQKEQYKNLLTMIQQEREQKKNKK